MKTQHTIIVAAAVLLTLVVPASRAQMASDADSAAIKATVMKLGAAFDAHDPKAMAACFAEDADFTNLRGVSRHGRADIAAFLAPLFGGVLKAASRTDSVRSVRMLTPALAADADSVITGSKAADGSDNPPRKGLVSLVMTKQGGQWLIEMFHEQDFPPAAAPAGK